MRDSQGKSKGFGFVCFEDPASAEKAVQELNGRTDETNPADDSKPKLFVGEARKKSERAQQLQINNFKYKKSIMFFSLFVKNFPAGTTEEELRIFFSSASNGEVTKVQIIPGTQQAFVNFEKQDCCKQAKEFARNVLFKSTFPLYAEYCYPKEMRLLRNEDIIDKRAQEKRKTQQNQAQIAQLSGSQNLIDLLTMLLKPHFQFNQTSQRRSHSVNTAVSSRTPMSAQGGINQQMMQQQQYRYQRGHQGNRHNMMNRGHSVGSQAHQMMQPQPPMMGSQVGMPQMNQSMMSGSSAATQPINATIQYAHQYQYEIQQMFISTEFKQGSSMDKKELVGNTIYKHVEKIIGESKAPKITGMLIDLPDHELNFSISNWNNFYQKVQSAYALIAESENQAPTGA